MRKDKFISKEEHISSGYDKFEQKSIGSEVNEILSGRPKNHLSYIVLQVVFVLRNFRS